IGVTRAYAPKCPEVELLATRIKQRAHIPGTRESIAAVCFRIFRIGLLIALLLRHATLALATYLAPPRLLKSSHLGDPSGWRSYRPRCRRATSSPRPRVPRPWGQLQRRRRPRSRRSSARTRPRGIGLRSRAPSLQRRPWKRAARIVRRRNRGGAIA